MRENSTDNIIIKDNVVYSIVDIKDEVREFEPMIIEHIKDIFEKPQNIFGIIKLRSIIFLLPLEN